MKKKIFLIFTIFLFLFLSSSIKILAQDRDIKCCDAGSSDLGDSLRCCDNQSTNDICKKDGDGNYTELYFTPCTVPYFVETNQRGGTLNCLNQDECDTFNNQFGSGGETISPIKPKMCQKATSWTGGGPVLVDYGIQTAIGCIPTEPQAFVSTFITWAIGIAGGVALLLMLFSAFGILTSAGDPEKLKASQERLTSAIIGLLFIIFSVFLLRIIGTPIMELGGGS